MHLFRIPSAIPTTKIAPPPFKFAVHDTIFDYLLGHVQPETVREPGLVHLPPLQLAPGPQAPSVLQARSRRCLKAISDSRIRRGKMYIFQLYSR